MIKISKFIDRTGEIGINNQGLEMKIISYRGWNDIDVEFDNGYISKNKYYLAFKKGSIKNLYFRNVYNVGYIGEGEYKTRIDGKDTIQYEIWHSIMERCYDEKHNEKYQTYRKCEICEEWICFQNFAKWYDENYYQIENEKMCIDKDILFKRNKLYSPNTCCFVPERINLLFVKNDANRGESPIGVSFREDRNKFRATMTKMNKSIFLGFYFTEHDAFKAYKQEKEKYIKEVADEYKDKIPKKLYDIMYNYEVEIED